MKSKVNNYIFFEQEWKSIEDAEGEGNKEMRETNISSDLTILVPLKDRVQYTRRLVNYLDFIECPYKLLFADGGQTPEAEELLQDKNNFLNLDYEYIRYPYDATLSDFHKKMASAVSKIQTPFTLLHDNDDFFVLETVQKCIDFLIKNSDHSSARGRNFDFHLSNEIYGQLYISREMWLEFPDSVIGENTTTRLLDQCSRFHANSHNVRRTKNLQATFELIEIIDFVNYRFAHQAESFLNVAWGKSNRKIEGIQLLHQGTAPSIGSNHFPPQEEWIKADYWKNDFIGMMDLCGAVIHYFDDISIEESRTIFADAYVNKLPDLKELLANRIEECKKEKINEDRIGNLLQCIKKSQNKEDIVAKGQTEVNISTEQELNALQFFLNSNNR